LSLNIRILLCFSAARKLCYIFIHFFIWACRHSSPHTGWKFARRWALRFGLLAKTKCLCAAVASFGRLLAATASFVFAAQGLRCNPPRSSLESVSVLIPERDILSRKNPVFCTEITLKVFSALQFCDMPREGLQRKYFLRLPLWRKKIEA